MFDEELGAPPEDPIGFRRFVDDIGGVWKGSKEDFICWSDRVNEGLKRYGLSIKDTPEDKWELNPPGSYTVFLDIKFEFDDELGVYTNANIKKTDARALLTSSQITLNKHSP